MQATPPPSGSIPSEPAVEVENLRGDEKRRIRDEVERQTKAAIATITTRLLDYYKREVDQFYEDELAKYDPLKAKLNQDYLNSVRTIFEKSANERGPLLTRLTFLTKFPPPDATKLVTVTSDQSDRDKKKATDIQGLQKSIAAIDAKYIGELDQLKAKNKALLDEEGKNLADLVNQKQKEINIRAENEATMLVRHFSSGLSERIFTRSTFQLHEIPTKTVNFPKIYSQPGAPRVPFDRAQLDADNKAELAKELETFLSLKRYERSPVANGARDATAEFIEWRTNLKSGHWENWQKSSKRK